MSTPGDRAGAWAGLAAARCSDGPRDRDRSGVVVLEALVGTIDQVDVGGHVLPLELSDVVIPFREVPLARDECERVLADVIGQCRLEQTGLLLLILVHRRRRDRKSTRLNSSHVAI